MSFLFSFSFISWFQRSSHFRRHRAVAEMVDDAEESEWIRRCVLQLVRPQWWNVGDIKRSDLDLIRSTQQDPFTPRADDHVRVSMLLEARMTTGTDFKVSQVEGRLLARSADQFGSTHILEGQFRIRLVVRRHTSVPVKVVGEAKMLDDLPWSARQWKFAR